MLQFPDLREVHGSAGPVIDSCAEAIWKIIDVEKCCSANSREERKRLPKRQVSRERENKDVKNEKGYTMKISCHSRITSHHISCCCW